MSNREDCNGAVTRLKQILNIPNKQFTEVKQAIRSLTISTLDIEIQGQNQRKELSAVVHKMQNKYPNILDNPHQLARARKLAMHYHCKVRERRRDNRRVRGGLVSRAKSTPDPSPERVVIVQPECVAGTRRKQTLGPLLTLWQDPQAEEQKNVSISLPPSNHSAASASQPIVTVTPCSGTALSAIHAFLRDCFPTMEHLLYRFVDLGFDSLEILQIIADKWSADERRDLLKRLSPSSNGKGVSELEVATLEKAFSALRSKI